MNIAKHIGTVIANNGRDITDLFKIGKIQHIGDFIFSAEYDGETVIIKTEPTDDSEEFIRITGVTVDESTAMVRKVGITYHMIRGNETAETFINMPISKERYMELASGCTPENRCWHEIREALANLTRLQGYDELGSWSIELTIGD
jgi:hypothetical protein